MIFFCFIVVPVSRKFIRDSLGFELFWGESLIPHWVSRSELSKMGLGDGGDHYCRRGFQIERLLPIEKVCKKGTAN